MPCPKFIDNTRECINEIEYMPANTFEYCVGDDYQKCPFYLIANNDPNVCKYVKKCIAFKCYALDEFQKFNHISQKYCVAKDHDKCARFKIRETGAEVPLDLHPDGHIMKNCYPS